MDVVRWTIRKPVAVAVGVILIVMFGLIGLRYIPVQLAPNVDRPVVTVSTDWAGRSPQEIVDEITKEQEEVLKNVQNLKSMRSTSSEGSAEIVLEFYIGTDVDRALQEVSDALRQVPEYPEDVDEPTIQAAEGSNENAIAWIMIEPAPGEAEKHPDFDIATLFDAVDREIKPYLERVDGIAEINVIGGRERELRVLVDATALANRQLNHLDVVEALRAENRNTSGGSVPEGKRDYRLRVIGQFESPEQVLSTIIAYREGTPVYVRDVAEVELGFERRRGFVRSLTGQALAINAIRQTGSNVMEVMESLQGRLDEVRADILPKLAPPDGPKLRMRQVYDETVYIKSAIDLVTQNLWVGGGIAALVLMLFLRSFISTAVIALAIPISVVGTFLVLLGLGRSLNVVSLAGLAFAVGMVVDNAIVVLENIDRRRNLGEGPAAAAYRGGREVFGAILASTLTTIAVFIPVLTIQEEAGQLFRDISLAIVASVTLSLIVSITVIPAATSRWLRPHRAPRHRVGRAFQSLFGLAPLFAWVIEQGRRAMLWLMTGWRGWSLRPAIIVAMTGASLIGAWALMPPLDYLPPGNRNLVFGGLLIPPGYSVEQREHIAERLEAHLDPYVEASPDDPESVAALPPIPQFSFDGEPKPPYQPVPVENFFIGSFGSSMFMGATSADPSVVKPVGQLITNAMNSIPDARGGASQASLFGRGAGGGNTINLEISGPDLERVRRAADFMYNLASSKYGYGDVRPDPSNFNLAQPEWQLRVNDTGAELGLRAADVGTVVRGLVDGAFVGDYQHRGDNIDLVVLPGGGRLEYKEKMLDTPIATPVGRVVPLDTVVDIVPSQAPQEISRIEELPSVTLRITPPEGVPLEQTMDAIRAEIVSPARETGLLDRTMRTRLEGTAAKLDEVRASLVGEAAPPGQLAGWQRVGWIVSIGIAALGGVIGLILMVRALRRRDEAFAYGAVGAALLALIVGGLLLGVTTQPQLVTARLIWALAVTYLLMAALFESFIYPFVIMLAVPLAIVGGFAGLKIVHEITLANPVLSPQQLDVLTMLGFIILVGIVVNNAILIVHQSLNFMRGWSAEGEASEPMEPLSAVAEAVKTRFRPIFMSALTSVGGMTPLVLFPGAGSELYRGLGSVVIGGLLVATIFTLVLVPLMFSLVLQMRNGLHQALTGRAAAPASVAPLPATERQREPIEQELERV